MLTDSKLVAFAATAMPEQSIDFYSNVLNLNLIADTPFALVFDANGTTLRIQKVETVTVTEYTILGWEVKNIITTARDLANKGVQFKYYANMPQDDLGIWKTPDGTMVAWFNDPDGNTLSVTQISA
ncbi:hypothetical protein AB833_10550 [Chromatiales bacterium (ex Bugula neritina AB1)]|nr:hypothetical protein AB833_10550 [Chromatiales bacterium (ex Bugula neritina AB1)]